MLSVNYSFLKYSSLFTTIFINTFKSVDKYLVFLNYDFIETITEVTKVSFQPKLNSSTLSLI